ncbi:Neuropeptide-Like Protein [Caenorhabditis elegans]|uniref:Neuropeptide-Like Protein n=1 Tax=Caenorhabditis elegans TaxID=6239 RepID=Q95X48_CAEEL|nr:Neuropeptide-Like Protein [Caenorhabditis elegans]CCD66741.1 Neuropeptide-Like Protein [Caenorhabditis elegans]|eukprot:NP_500482.1 Uncharacterized protein CELE_C35B1.7 [Caenorhabditis elegans]
MKSFLSILLISITISSVIGAIDGKRRPMNRNSYYEFLMRAQHGSASKDPIVSSRSPKMDRNCFFSPVQCMFDTSSADALDSFRR